MRTMLKSKIHRARVTDGNISYEGSVTIDKNLMDAADIMPYEQVHILDVNNGARFHTYAIEWNKDVVVWYVDGVERHRSCEGVPQKEMYLIMNLAIGGPVPGNPDENTKFPNSFDIDYVRVYKKIDK